MGVIPEHIDRLFDGRSPAERKQLIGTIYVEYRQEFVAWALKNHRLSTDEILDIYQDATAILYEKAVQNSIEAKSGSVKTYLYGIAKNLLLRKFEKQDVVTRHQETVKEHYDYLSADSTVDSPEAKKATKAINEMQEPCKSILMLFYFEQLSIQRIAEALNYTNPNVVKTQKSRCMSKLKQMVMAHFKPVNEHD